MATAGMKLSHANIQFQLDLLIEMLNQKMVREKSGAVGLKYNEALKHLQIACNELDTAEQLRAMEQGKTPEQSMIMNAVPARVAK